MFERSGLTLLALGLALWCSLSCSAGDGSTTALAAGSTDSVAKATEASESQALAPYRPRHGRSRPLVAVIGENYYTELADFVVPWGILRASQAADVVALGMTDGPIRMFPAPVNVLPQQSAASFDAAHPEGADYVIVPAVHRDDDPALLAWVKAQASKGAVMVGVCDGVWVLARAGLLEGRRATGHWYSWDDLRRKYPTTRFVADRRYVVDGPVVTTTGVTAAVPVSLALVEAIAGHARAAALAAELGATQGWSAEHDSRRFRMGLRQRLTVARNAAALWAHEDLGVAINDGVDEIALALQANAYSTTFKSTVYTVAAANPVRSRRGLLLVPDRTPAQAKGLRMLAPPGTQPPMQVLQQALRGLEHDYGADTAAWVTLQMEYPGH